MRKLKTFFDKRLTVSSCIFCGKESSTNDHSPSKILLETPYPTDLPIAPACKKCNESFAPDEEYVASILECAINGSVDSIEIRPKIKKVLDRQSSLKKKILKQRRIDDAGNIVWEIDTDRLKNLLFKLSSGHVYYELELAKLGLPDHIGFMPLALMNPNARMQFESNTPSSLLPEIGTRLFQRVLENPFDTWQVVQIDRYRYRVSQSDHILVQIVFSEFLVAEVIWLENLRNSN